MSDVTVKIHPFSEVLEKKLFGFGGVPYIEQKRMVSRAIKAAVAEYNKLRAEVEQGHTCNACLKDQLKNGKHECCVCPDGCDVDGIILQLRSENKELKEYLMKMLDDQPRTKDGVTVTDGMELFGAKIKEPIMSLMAETRAYYVDSDGAHVSDSVGEYFSTQEAFDQSTEGR